MEIWKPVKGYEGLYEVSSEGNVRSLDHVSTFTKDGKQGTALRKGRLLKPVKRQHGYLGVMLYGKGGHKTRGFKTFAVHRLVAEAFIPNPNDLPEVNHIDEDKTNNRVENLAWISHIDNTNFGTTQRRRSEKIRNNKKSRPVSQFAKDGKCVCTYPSLGEVKRQTGYSGGNVWRALQKGTHAYGFIWRYASEIDARESV